MSEIFVFIVGFHALTAFPPRTWPIYIVLCLTIGALETAFGFHLLFYVMGLVIWLYLATVVSAMTDDGALL